jgi:RNA polymerase sigma-70 factor (ECF subfamily)
MRGVNVPHRPKSTRTVFVKVCVVTLTSAATLFSGLVRPPPSVWVRRRLRESSMAKLSDRELVDRAREGDAQAFGQLVRRHQQRIHRLATHLLRDRAEAEDVMQETFIRAYRALARFDGRSEPYTWFYRIAINLSLNALRSRKSRRTTTESDDARLDAILSENQTLADSPDDAARNQLYAALSQGIDELSDTLRTTLVLVCIDGRSHEEASAILGAPEGTIAWRVHEARRKLKEYMVKRGFDPEEMS